MLCGKQRTSNRGIQAWAKAELKGRRQKCDYSALIRDLVAYVWAGKAKSVKQPLVLRLSEYVVLKSKDGSIVG